MNITKDLFIQNPFKPGAGHLPPYLAGREAEKTDFSRHLRQTTILSNIVLTGLRGVGKTVLLNEFRLMALKEGWLWVGTDLSESASISEANLAERLLADISLVSASIIVKKEKLNTVGFIAQKEQFDVPLNYKLLKEIYENTPGLVADKIKSVLSFVSSCVTGINKRGIVFAYDEAQTLSDHAAKNQYPLSVLLDVFQSLQRQNIPFMLVLTGLPTLFSKLVEARTFSERMFHVITLYRLSANDSRDAIVIPIDQSSSPITLGEDSINTIIEISQGYPYFIQFICKEVFDIFVQQINEGEKASVPVQEILQKLDSDFFAGRWSRATDRQRELMTLIAYLEQEGEEFTVQEVHEASKIAPGKPFSKSNIGQMFSSLSDTGLIYRNRHGKYSFAVPLLDRFIKRQIGIR